MCLFYIFIGFIKSKYSFMCATSGGSNLLMGPKQVWVWDSWKYDYDTWPQKETTNLHICCYLDRNLDGIKIKIILYFIFYIYIYSIILMSYLYQVEKWKIKLSEKVDDNALNLHRCCWSCLDILGIQWQGQDLMM